MYSALKWLARMKDSNCMHTLLVHSSLMMVVIVKFLEFGGIIMPWLII